MNLSSTPDDTPVTLLLDGERPKVWALGELREALGGPEERPQDSDNRQAIIDMWVRKSRESLHRNTGWGSGGSAQGREA